MRMQLTPHRSKISRTAALLDAASSFVIGEYSPMTPELTFCEDHSIAHGAHISKLLNEIEFAPESSEDLDGEN